MNRQGRKPSSVIRDRNARIVALWREGKTDSEIAAIESVKRLTVSCVVTAARQWLGVEAVPYHHTEPSRPKSDWLKIARLWRAGQGGAAVASAMGVPRYQGSQLIAQARYHLGVKKVPTDGLTRRSLAAFEKREAARSTVPITMADIDRHYLRRVGDEFIFRDAQDVEEVWVEGENGLKHYKKRLVFKCKLGV